MKEFTIGIVVVGHADAHPSHAGYAVKRMLERAKQFSPDARFDWAGAQIVIDHDTSERADRG